MSTYTDLKNHIKETITVGSRPEDRITTQKVRFYNRENEYWGSFSGSLSGKINIYKGELSSVDIYNATLINPAVKSSTGLIIDLGSVTDQLEELSVYAYEDLSGAIKSCAENIIDISNAISAVSADTADQLSGLSSAFGDEVLSRISADEAEVSSRISADEAIKSEFKHRLLNLAMRAASADNYLHDKIIILSGELSDEVSDRVQADTDLSTSLMSYADRRRHYEIYSMDAASQMPIKAKEFAVNKLINYDLPNGFVVDDRNQIVGSVEGYDAVTGDCRFTAYSDANYSVADESGVKEFPYAHILGLNSYNFDSSTNVRQCPDAVHQLVYMRAANPSNFDQNQFDIRVMMPNMRTVKHNGRTIGYVYGAGTETSVSAGTLQFIPSELIGDSNLSTFAKNTPVPFSVNLDNGVISSVYENCDLRLISAVPMFHYRAQISAWPFKPLSGGFEDCFARVYRDLQTKDDGGLVSQFAVSMVAKHDTAAGQQDFYLQAPDFESVLHTYDDKSFDLLKYDDTSKVISYTNEKKYLSCLVRIVDSKRQFDLPLSSLDANTSLLEASHAAISFAPLSNAVNDAIRPLITVGPYTLSRSDGVLSCEVTTHISEDEVSRVAIQIYDTGSIFAKFQSPDGNTVVFRDNDQVYFDQTGAYDKQDTQYGKCEFDANNTDFSRDPLDERCAEEGNFWIGAAAGEGNEYTGLKFQREYQKKGRPTYNVNDIVIEIPDKVEGAIESREFLFVIRPQGSGLLGQKATIKFVTPRGEPVDFFAEHLPEFKIDCGKYITFRLQEITYGKFALLDWDQSMQESRLDYLDATISSEISNRISAVSDLSVKLSGEVDSLSARLSGEIDALSTRLSNEIDSLSVRLSGEVDSLSTALSGEIDILSVKLSGEIDSLSTALSGEIDTLSVKLSGELSVQSEQILSNRTDIDFLLYAERKSMVYLGTLLSVNDHEDKDLSCYFENALGFHTEPSFKFKQGFTFRISAEQTDLYGSDDVRISFHPSDVLTFNRDTELSAVCAGDIDVINDYNTELYDMSAALSGEIGSLSSALSNDIGSLSTRLSGEIDTLSAALSSEIDTLSAKLSDEIGSLSTALSNEISSLSSELVGLISSTSSDITGIISSVSSDISAAADAKFALSSNLAELSNDFGDLKNLVDRTIDDPGDSRPGVVNIVDEYYYAGESSLRNYKMHMISGTIMLVKIA